MKTLRMYMIRFLYLSICMITSSYTLNAGYSRYRVGTGRLSRSDIARTVAAQTDTTQTNTTDTSTTDTITPTNTTPTETQTTESAPTIETTTSSTTTTSMARPSSSSTNTGARWTREGSHTTIHARTMALANQGRTIVNTSTTTLRQLLEIVSRETTALFYLVDSTGNPVSLNNITTAIGSKSVQIPDLTNITEEQQGMLDNTSITVEENVDNWVSTYLNNVRETRSKSLTGPSLTLFDQYWQRVQDRYNSALKQIFRTISVAENIAQSLGFTSIGGVPITLLFFDDPFPAHTVPGTAKTPFRDLLGTFIARYGL